MVVVADMVYFTAHAPEDPEWPRQVKGRWMPKPSCVDDRAQAGEGGKRGHTLAEAPGTAWGPRAFSQALAAPSALAARGTV